MIRKETFELMHKECNNYMHRGGFCYAEPDQAMPLCSYENCPAAKTSEETSKDKIPSPEEFADEMIDIYKKYYLEEDDEEDTHWEMDVAITNLLSLLGYEEAVWIFKNTPRWYA